MCDLLDKLILLFIIISFVCYKLFAKDDKALSRYVKLVFSINISWLFPFVVVSSMKNDLSTNIVNFTVYINSVIIFLCFQYLLYKHTIETKIKNKDKDKDKDNT